MHGLKPVTGWMLKLSQLVLKEADTVLEYSTSTRIVARLAPLQAGTALYFKLGTESWSQEAPRQFAP